MRNSAAAQPSSPAATYVSGAAYVAPASSAAMYGSGASYVAPAASAPGGGGYIYPAPASSGGSAGYSKIPTYPAVPSAYPNPSRLPPRVSTHAPVEDPTALPSPLAKAGELVTRLREQGQVLIAARRPWGEVFRAPAFSKPPSLGEAIARMRRNTAYFRANYALAVLAVVAASLLWHPGTLFVLLFLCAAWFFLYFARPAQGGQPLRVLGMEFDDGSVLAALCGVTVIAMLFTSVGWNVVGSVMIGGALVSAHAALRTTDDLFLTEQEAAGDGLLAAGMSAAGPMLPTYVRIG
ncbi:PRA1 family protein B4 [Zea mays]|jgi:PRA1 family protein 1|uniref:PRA1 family protein n=2 Tax=Zea mays TaxID=4577 RepID=A0A8J8YJ12_MAIZE|nr:prenylated Rab receptor 2 [Zea mays]PWZ53464.1 PRA1 family protein B4 [Zea mays]